MPTKKIYPFEKKIYNPHSKKFNPTSTSLFEQGSRVLADLFWDDCTRGTRDMFHFVEFLRTLQYFNEMKLYQARDNVIQDLIDSATYRDQEMTE